MFCWLQHEMIFFFSFFFFGQKPPSIQFWDLLNAGPTISWSLRLQVNYMTNDVGVMLSQIFATDLNVKYSWVDVIDLKIGISKSIWENKMPSQYLEHFIIIYQVLSVRIVSCIIYLNVKAILSLFSCSKPQLKIVHCWNDFSMNRKIACRSSSYQSLYSALVELCRLSCWVGFRDKKWMACSIYGWFHALLFFVNIV